MKIKAVTKVLSQPFFQINSILLPTPRSQVAIFIKYEKLFFNIIPCNSELNGDSQPLYALNILSVFILLLYLICVQLTASADYERYHCLLLRIS